MQKQIFIKETPIDPSKTTCCVCGFWVDIEGAHQASENKKKEETSFYQEYL